MFELTNLILQFDSLQEKKEEIRVKMIDAQKKLIAAENEIGDLENADDKKHVINIAIVNNEIKNAKMNICKLQKQMDEIDEQIIHIW